MVRHAARETRSPLKPQPLPPTLRRAGRFARAVVRGRTRSACRARKRWCSRGKFSNHNRPIGYRPCGTLRRSERRPNTVARAYTDPQSRGWVIGGGTRVAPRVPAADKRSRSLALREAADRFVAALLGRGLGQIEIAEELRRIHGALTPAELPAILP